jgi:transcription-repair coupling factor (superfamily II helicase)
LDSILQPVFAHPAFREACAAAATEARGVVLAGLTRSAKALIVAGLTHALHRPLLVLTKDNGSADYLQQNVGAFLGLLKSDVVQSPKTEGGGTAAIAQASTAVSVLPAFDCSPYEGRSPHPEISERRAVTLWRVARGRAEVLVAPLPAALGRFRQASYYRSLVLELKVGDELNLDDLIEHLTGIGYEAREPANTVGLFSIRGGIVDVYPPEAEWPFRLEFFGDQIESVREFDPATQRSLRTVPSAVVLPMMETRLSPQFFADLVRVLAGRSQRLAPGVCGEQGDAAEGKPMIPSREPEWGPAYSNSFPGWEFFVPLVEAHRNSLLSLFAGTGRPALGLDQAKGEVDRSEGGAPIVVWDEPLELHQLLKLTEEAWKNSYEEVRDMEPPRPRPTDIFLTESEFWESVEGMTQIGLKELSVASGQPFVIGRQSSEESQQLPTADIGPRTTNYGQETNSGGPPTADYRHSTTNEFILLSQPAPKFHGAVKTWIEEARAGLERGDTTVLFVPTTGKVERLRELLEEYEVTFADLGHTLQPRPIPASRVPAHAPVFIVHADVGDGTTFPELKLALLTDSDIFGGFAWGTPRRREKSAASSFISDLSDLKVGDFVVHIDHGIGLYRGLRVLEVDGGRHDFMLITYQDDAKLYVPLERLDLVEKYRSGSGMEGAKPVLDRMGGVTWARTKTRVKRALRDMAEELLGLYAARKMSGGTAFGPDTPWQKELEDAFEFEETPDQLSALAEIKRDLESPEPMDRLLCGDVGYGKTELAMRAAFKVIQDGRQVAVLAPTTVLAFQHFNTFRQRMAAFPVRVEMLSRFRSAAEQKKTISEVQAGRVDIVVGTHRLLSKDVGFHDLGLLVVDEEQRFGVAAKEKLRKLRASVDVLTMSATPIPRTLHMALGGLRDLSVIETPPRGRLAIQTIVAPFSDALIQAAIVQEMERQGQVFFVHNRVESIFSIAAIIQRLVPAARIGVSHGQMGERELEKVMMKLVRGEYDVLVATSIIENGLDIPLANTLIVNRADRFGLADLYQLRGRVGRADRRAYAYFLIPDEETLTPIAKRRLAALKEFSDLGAGFRLAALDLELRGTGNLLGAEQSGHMNSIGLDLYLKMLEQSVRELKGTPSQPDVRTTLNLGLEIKIPESFIADESQRLRMYKRVSSIATAEERADMQAELIDRFGPIPTPVQNLLNYALLKSAAEKLLIQSVERKADELWVRFHPQSPVDPERLTHFVRERRESSLRPDGILRFRLTAKDGDLFVRIQNALQELQP